MRIVELKIDELDDFSGFTEVALVENPAIEADFHYFNKEDADDAIAYQLVKALFIEHLEEEFDLDITGLPTYVDSPSGSIVEKDVFESYTDYPKQAIENAKIALRWAEENGWGDCATAVGKARANQLAKGEPISEETIARMASFARHRENGQRELGDGCGRLSWLAWGGDAGVDWAQRKLKEIKDGLSQEFSYIDDLSIEIQDKIVETLEDKGITLDSLLKEGWVVLKEEEMGEEQFGLPTKSDAKPDAYTDEGTQKLKVLYQYRGPVDDKNRKFCSRMMSLTDKYGLLWRKEDIDRLSIMGKNEEFSSYDIFQYRGSFNCRHRWTKVYLKREQITPLDETKLSKHSFSLDEEKRLIVGPLMLADKLILRVDENDEPYYVYFTKSTIKSIATKMMKEKFLDRVNIEHNEQDRVDAYMVESWIVEDQYKDKQQVFGLSYPPGSWIGMYKIEDDRAWEMVKEGKVKAFSIEGYFADKLIQAKAV